MMALGLRFPYGPRSDSVGPTGVPGVTGVSIDASSSSSSRLERKKLSSELLSSSSQSEGGE